MEPATEEPAPPPRLGLNLADELAIQELLRTDDQTAVALRQHLLAAADALAGPDRDDSRVRLLAKLIATSRVRMAAWEALRDQRLAARDVDAVELLDRLITRESRRLLSYMEEHRMSSETRQRSVTLAAAHVSGLVVRSGE